MTSTAQLALFVSSYAPLFAVMALLDSFGKGWPSVVLAVAAGLGVLVLVVVLRQARRLAPQDLQVEAVQARDGDALAYVATYLVPFAAIAASTTRERLALGLFLLLLAVIYVRSELFYVNPLLAVIGYRLFQASTPGGASVVILSRQSFVRANTTLNVRRLGSRAYWEVPR